MNIEKIGSFLAKLRDEKKLKQIDVANMLGISPKTISKWENGNGLPDISLLNDLANLYDIEIEEILNGEKNTKKRKIEKRNKNINLIFKILLFILIPFFIYFLVFFCVEYNSYNVYKVTAKNDDNRIDGYVVKKNNLLFFNISFIKINKEYITDTNEYTIEVYYNDKLINTFNKNNITYSIYNNVNLDNLYYKIIYDNATKDDIIIKCEYKSYKSKIKTGAININELSTKNTTESGHNLLNYGFVDKDSFYEYKDDTKYIQLYKYSNNITYQEENDIIISIKYYNSIKNMEASIYQKSNGKKILLEKYTYNTKSKEIDCATEICTSVDDMVKIVDFYLSLLTVE